MLNLIIRNIDCENIELKILWNAMERGTDEVQTLINSFQLSEEKDSSSMQDAGAPKPQDNVREKVKLFNVT